jgi:hypothetical protein
LRAHDGFGVAVYDLRIFLTPKDHGDPQRQQTYVLYVPRLNDPIGAHCKFSQREPN